MKTIAATLVAVATASWLAACGRKVNQPDLIEHRVATCEKMCKVYADPDCGTATNPSTRKWEFADCVEECATLDGVISTRWGYLDSTKQDLCIAEFHAYVDCLAGLTCEDQRIYFSDEGHLTPETRPCFPEDDAALGCVLEVSKQNEEAAS